MNSKQAIDFLAAQCDEPTSWQRGWEIHREAVAVLEAEAQALADVRTLDALWQSDSYGTYRLPVMGPPDAEGIRTTFVGTGPTPDAARHAAADWVRQQSGTLTHSSTSGNEAGGGTPIDCPNCFIGPDGKQRCDR